MSKILIGFLTVMFCQNAFAVKSLEQVLSEAHENKRGDKVREHVIDPYRVERMKKREEQEKLVKETCKTVKNSYKRFDCFNQGMNKWLVENPDRGTKEFGDKFYANLSLQSAKAKLNELVSLMDYVSFHPASKEDKDTELTVNLLHGETMYIERYVLKVNPKDHRPFK